MNIAYIGGKSQQGIENQRFKLEKNNIGKWYIEEIGNEEKPVLKKLICEIREDDTIFIDNIFRMSRDVAELGKIVDLVTEKRATIKIESFEYDINSPKGKLLFSIALATKQELDKLEEA